MLAYFIQIISAGQILVSREGEFLQSSVYVMIMGYRIDDPPVFLEVVIIIQLVDPAESAERRIIPVLQIFFAAFFSLR